MHRFRCVLMRYSLRRFSSLREPPTTCALQSSKRLRLECCGPLERNTYSVHLCTSSISFEKKTTDEGGGRGGQLCCPNCGEPCSHVETMVSSTRFVKCENCNHFFVVLAQIDSKRPQHTESESPNDNTKTDPTLTPRDPPPPKKIYEYLSNYVVGQEQAKKVLSVAVYNHYKRLLINLPSLKESSNLDNINFDENFQTRGGSHTLQLASSINTNSASGDSSVPGKDKNEKTESTAQSSSESESLKDDNAEIKIDKSNILILGPTGSGKTLLAQTVAKCLDVPFAICDCTSLTAAGYVGEDIESIIAKLLLEANYNVGLAQQGIVFLDEVDKISCVSGSFQSTRDVGGEGVQQGLLKMLEGTVVNVPERGARKKGSYFESYLVDTTNILFVASGAFSGLENLVKRRKQDRSLGFGTTLREQKPMETLDLEKISQAEATALSEEKDELISVVEPQDLIKFGMIPEFVGRLPIIASVTSLSEQSLVKILTEPRNALVPQYQHLFKMDEVDLQFSDDSLRSIAQTAKERKTGARGLKAILEKILLDPMYEVPQSDITAVYICKDTVKGMKKADYVKGPLQTTNLDLVDTVLQPEDICDEEKSVDGG